MYLILTLRPQYIIPILHMQELRLRLGCPVSSGSKQCALTMNLGFPPELMLSAPTKGALDVHLMRKRTPPFAGNTRQILKDGFFVFTDMDISLMGQWVKKANEEREKWYISCQTGE